MAGLRTGAVARAVHSLQRQAPRGLDLDALGEIEQQFQLPIEGEAAPTIAWFEQDLVFDVEFYNATEQRFSPFTLPHFWFGPVIESVTPVLVTACVRRWDLRRDDAVTGARVAVGTCSPGATELIEFTGYLHLTFQGYGAPAESGIDLDITGG